LASRVIHSRVPTGRPDIETCCLPPHYPIAPEAGKRAISNPGAKCFAPLTLVHRKLMNKRLSRAVPIPHARQPPNPTWHVPTVSLAGPFYSVKQCTWSGNRFPKEECGRRVLYSLID